MKIRVASGKGGQASFNADTKFAVKSDELVFLEIGDIWVNLSQYQVQKVIKALKKHHKKVEKRDELAEMS